MQGSELDFVLRTNVKIENNRFKKKDFPITLVCDHIYFQQNLGSLFRIGEAFGIEKIIFIGKSRNIKKRVNQHFTGITTSAKKIQKEVFQTL